MEQPLPLSTFTSLCYVAAAMERTTDEVAKLLKKFTTGELMREVRRRQVSGSSATKRSETAKRAAAIRWAKKKGKDILESNE